MKKIFRKTLVFLLLVGMLAFSFASCTNQDPDSETTAPVTETAPVSPTTPTASAPVTTVEPTPTPDPTGTTDCQGDDDKWASFGKPVIYLYPQEDIVCSVYLDFDGKLGCTYPHYNNGWKDFTAKKDGTLVFPDGNMYYALFWDGISDYKPEFSTGFCVKGSESAEFLEQTLSALGLTWRERNEFIMYWLPQLECNEYNLISFDTKDYEEYAELTIDPMPDSILRVFMTAKAVDHYVEIEPEVYTGFVRNGFTVVEWGGTIIG